MIIKVDQSKCSGCKKCIEICPVNAIEEDIVSIDMSRCIKCRSCAVSCPSKAIVIK
ncbi:4Fe-4S dicluster domain-containing protein [Crassaminicella thermophila]|uniref:Ferredoxin n=1 Tax=Crassaminicella thermophila TaxID=2599308 RepID=A0A5C0SAV3_CRATE|nr:4Fe-4S binding protein [Crassaminicella thermophila]QEK11713.1 4Fe-4S dicluster domain-containing protein [Crassaminicella thermophila]